MTCAAVGEGIIFLVMSPTLTSVIPHKWENQDNIGTRFAPVLSIRQRRRGQVLGNTISQPYHAVMNALCTSRVGLSYTRKHASSAAQPAYPCADERFTSQTERKARRHEQKLISHRSSCRAFSYRLLRDSSFVGQISSVPYQSPRQRLALS